MSQFEMILYFGIIPFVVISLTVVLLIILYYKRRKTKMYLQIEAALDEYVKSHPGSEYVKSDVLEYDYVLSTAQAKYYIMVVPNFHCGELFLSSSTKWSIKRSYEEETSRFVPRIDKLARFDPPYEGGKEIKRIYIIYPTAKSILRYINDCEMEFIHYDTDVNGSYLITYYELKDKKIEF